MTTALLEAHKTPRSVPKLDGLKLSACKSCKLWFARPPKFTKCLYCTTSKDQYRVAVETAQRAAQDRVAVKIVKPLNQKIAGDYSLGRAMAMVKAIELDFPNVKPADLKPAYRDLWSS